MTIKQAYRLSVKKFLYIFWLVLRYKLITGENPIFYINIRPLLLKKFPELDEMKSRCPFCELFYNDSKCARLEERKGVVSLYIICPLSLITFERCWKVYSFYYQWYYFNLDIKNTWKMLQLIRKCKKYI